MLIVKPQIDLTQIKKDWDEWVKLAAEGWEKINEQGGKAGDAPRKFGGAAKKAGADAEELERKAVSALEAIADSAEETRKATEGIFARISLEDQIGAFGDLKDVFEKTAGSLLGVSDAAIEAAVNVGDVVEKGANIGKVLGPEAAIAGAAIGLVVGVTNEWIQASENAKAAQIALAQDALAQTQARLAAQEAQLAINIKVWSDYAIAVKRANGVQLDIIEGLVDADAAAFAKEEEGRQKRLEAYQKNVSDIEIAMRAHGVEVLSAQEVIDAQMAKAEGARFSASREEQLAFNEDLIKNKMGLDRVQEEVDNAAADRSYQLSVKVREEAVKAFDEAAKSTEEFNKELGRIHSPPTLADLKKDEQDAADAAKRAEERIADLKKQLAEPVKEGEGFEDYAARIKGLLVDAAAAAGALSKAQADLLKAASATESGKPKAKTKSGKTFAELAKEQQDEQDASFAKLAANEKANEEQALLDAVAAEDKKQEVQDAADVDALNNQMAFEKRAQASWQDYRINEIKIAQDAADERQAIRDAELQASTDFYNTLIDGALGAAEIIANALAGTAVDAYNEYLDAIANGEKRSKDQRKRNRAETEREIGTNLITDGTSHILMGAAKAVVPDTSAIGFAEAAAGAAEVLFGAGLGGLGARAQRKLGGTEAPDRSTPDRGSADSLGGDLSTKELAPVVINYSTQFPATEREIQTFVDKLDDMRRRPR